MGAAADCETIGTGLFAQPVNALTTLGFLAAAVWIVRRRHDRIWVAAAVVATGVGSFLFHGPMPPGSQWAHDVTLAWLLLVIAGVDTRWERLSRLPGLVVIGVLLAWFPSAADPLGVGLAAMAVVVRLAVDRSGQTVAALSLLAVVGIIGRLGATGWPLCDPESIWQTHGLWHLGAAFAVAWWGGQRAD